MPWLYCGMSLLIHETKFITSWDGLVILILTQTNCNHFASVKMPGLKNRRECMLCHKFFEETSKWSVEIAETMHLGEILTATNVIRHCIKKHASQRLQIANAIQLMKSYGDCKKIRRNYSGIYFCYVQCLQGVNPKLFAISSVSGVKYRLCFLSIL